MNHHHNRCPEYKKICAAWHSLATKRTPYIWSLLLDEFAPNEDIREAVAALIWWDYLCDSKHPHDESCGHIEALRDAYGETMRHNGYIEPDRAEMVRCMVAMDWPEIIAMNRTQPAKPRRQKKALTDALG